ncbi:class I SAM-dependent methyltransferase [Pontibacter toksunensis]|uniref:Class I SAM-dependent methyltransferase n=1 Tax=Pontibacter toksunensis TaxID=1332631 RepID=A0ABW6BWN3_9BACT
MTQTIVCPLCEQPPPFRELEGPDGKDYYLCSTCYLIFADRRWLPSKEEEVKHYLNHENGIQHQGYIDFLNKAVHPALPYLRPGMQGLDYGCGSAPAISLLLKKEGYTLDNYDPFFFPELDAQKKYDFIFSTESFEHFFNPKQDLQRLSMLLNKEGLLVIMTEQWKKEETFAHWYYVRDPTHVSFYHQHTFRKICSQFNFVILFTDNNRVTILRKK